MICFVEYLGRNIIEVEYLTFYFQLKKNYIIEFIYGFENYPTFYEKFPTMLFLSTAIKTL